MAFNSTGTTSVLFGVGAAFLGVNYFHQLSVDQLIPMWDIATFLNSPWQLAHYGIFTWIGGRPVANVITASVVWLFHEDLAAVNCLSIIIFATGLFFYHRMAKEVFGNSVDGLVLCMLLGMSYLVTFWVRNSVPYSLGITTAIIAAYFLVIQKKPLLITLLVAIGFLSHPSVIFLAISYTLFMLFTHYRKTRGFGWRTFFLPIGKHALVFLAPIVTFDSMIRVNRFITFYPGDTSARGIIPTEIAARVPFAEPLYNVFGYLPDWLLKFLSNSDAGNINESYLRESWAYSFSSASTSWGQATWFDGLSFYPKVIAYVENPIIGVFILLSLALLVARWKKIEFQKLRGVSLVLAFALAIVMINALRGGITVARGIMVIYPIVLFVLYYVTRNVFVGKSLSGEPKSGGTIRIAAIAFVIMFLGYSLYYNTSLRSATTPYWKIKTKLEAVAEKDIYVCSRNRILWSFLVNELARKQVVFITNQVEADSFNASMSPKILIVCQYADPKVPTYILTGNAAQVDTFSNEFSHLPITLAEGGVLSATEYKPNVTRVFTY